MNDWNRHCAAAPGQLAGPLQQRGDRPARPGRRRSSSAVMTGLPPLRTIARSTFRGPPGGDLNAFDGVLGDQPREADEMTVEKQRIGLFRTYRLRARTATPNARMNPMIGRRDRTAMAVWFM